MARPTKIGLDYFPLDTRMEDKIKLIEAKYGIEGFGILIKLYQKIYDHGYYIDWKEENCLLFSSEVNVNINKVNEVINDCLHWQIFDNELCENHNILTSHGIQIRFIEATKRRKKVEIIEEYSLLDNDEINENIVFVNINPVNVDNNSKNDDKSTQSKVKESKVNNNNIRSDSKNPNPAPKEIKIMFDKNTKPYKAAVYLRKSILSNHPRQPVPNETPEKLQDWALELDRLNRLGPPGGEKGYSWKEIGKIMMWCQQDNFWKGNILSAGKFREKIVTLESQMKRSGGYDKYQKQHDAISSLMQKFEEEEDDE